MQRSIDSEVRRAIRNQLIFSVLLVLAGLVLDALAFFNVPSMLRGRSFLGGIFLAIAAIAMPWYGIWNFRRNLRWRNNLDEHPAFVCPAFGAPSQVRQALQHVLNAPGAVKVGPVLATADWMLEVGRWGVQSVYFPSVAWCYKHVTAHKYYGIITIRKSYAFHLWTVDGKQVVRGEVKEAEVDQLLALTAERAPAAVCGHTKEAEDLWNNHREKFLQSVEYRRQCLAQEATPYSSTAPPAWQSP